MRLSDFFAGAEVARDGEFDHLDEASSQTPGALVFGQQLDYLKVATANPNVSCVITKPELANDAGQKGVVLTADPRLAFFVLYRQLFAEGLIHSELEFGIDSGARIHPTAVVSKLARIGRNVTVCAGAIIEDYVVIGNDSYIGHGAIAGSEGMLTIRNGQSHITVPHAGGVEIGSGVMLLAGSVIAKSLYRQFTTIQDFCQIGVRASIGHGATLGQRCIVSAGASVGGRVSIGDDARIGMSSSIAQGLSIGRGADIKMGSIVVSNVKQGEVVSGNFAIPHRAHLKQHFKRKNG
jgi:UDP-3-O-[3-hydroxymyristoyl] glucosamine N-acyltransferase